MNYDWLKDEKAPRILVEAVKLIGTREIPGPRSNPVILEWAKEIGGPVARWYDDDDEAWCGLFMAVCIQRAGYEPPKGFDSIRALRYAFWGDDAPVPMLGDALVFNRNGGGHVGLYVGEDADAYHVLGGNQNNAVNVSRLAKHRLFASRRTAFKIGKPKNVRKIFLNSSGELSHNET
jgi:uncharacterized protein (TIGR02594 family)